MPYSYKVKPGTTPLTEGTLKDGMLVCFNNVQTNPNNVGTLKRRVPQQVANVKLVWEAVINNTYYQFDKDGKINGTGSSVLYEVLSDGDIEPTQSTGHTRAPSAQGESNTVSLTYMTPKDYFAINALNALIASIPNPLSMDDGTIASIAAKSYKIAQAMAKEAYGSRQNDKNSTDAQGTDYVVVDETSLQTNTERILYNINESIKASTKSAKDTGIKITSIPDVVIGNTQNDPVYTEEVTI